ncbi:MAG: serine hydrolase domain-containing protein [Aggregatilineales bacterium]
MNAESLTEQLGIAVERLIAPAPGSLYNAAAVEIRHNSQIVYRGAFGQDISGQPTRPDTLFDLGSLTELFTVTAFLRLVDTGKLWIDTPVDVVLQDFAGDVTFYHLLTHTASLPLEIDLCALPDYDARIAAIIDAKPTSLANVLNIPNRLRVIRNPDHSVPSPPKQRYSPLDAMLIGLAIETLTDLPLAQALAMLILQPIGVRAQYAPLPPYASVTAWEVADSNTRCLDGIAGHAGLFGTVSDVATLAHTYLSNGTHGNTQLLSSEIVGEAIHRHTNSGGLGWQYDTAAVVDPLGFGFRSDTGAVVWADPSRQLIVALVTDCPSELLNSERPAKLWDLSSGLLTDVRMIIDTSGE